MNAAWKHKDIWTMRGKDFLVEVSRHAEQESGEAWGNGPHRWCVYAYIYPAHPHFANFSGNQMWQDAASSLPLHGGPSFLRWHRNDEGKPTSVQVGADYNHLHDEYFTHYDTAKEAQEVFEDAERLHAWLSNAPQEVAA